MALLLSHLGASSLGFKSSWLVLSLLFGCAGAFSSLAAPAINPFGPCLLPPVSKGAKLTTITYRGVSRSWYTYVPASVAAAQTVVPLVVELHGLYGCVTGAEVHRMALQGRGVWVHPGLAAGRGRADRREWTHFWSPVERRNVR